MDLVFFHDALYQFGLSLGVLLLCYDVSGYHSGFLFVFLFLFLPIFCSFPLLMAHCGYWVELSVRVCFMCVSSSCLSFL